MHLFQLNYLIIALNTISHFSCQMIETWPGFLTVRNNLPCRRLRIQSCRILSVPTQRGDYGVCAALAGVQLFHQRCSEATAEYKKKKTAPVYTDSSCYLFYPFTSIRLLIICLLAALLKGTLNPFYSTHQLISPPIYPSHNELLCLHYIPILLHQPGG